MQQAYATHDVIVAPRTAVGPIVRIFDFVGASILLVVAVPAALICAGLTRFSGPGVIFSQPRVGFRGRLFRCFKFRTMVPNADEVLERLLASDAAARAEWSAGQKLRNDPRVTRIGVLMRRLSLDELPQLYNVLRGEMSLVGPRPVLADELSRYGEYAGYYLAVRPGITGLWQISGRNHVSYDERVRMDVRYVQTKSLFTDILILLKTVRAVFSGRGAY